MYGLIGKMTATEGQRDALIAILRDGIQGMPGCLSYIVAKDPADEDAIWITEVWDSAESHKASLSLPAVREAIGRARPIIAGFDEAITTEPVNGHGLVETIGMPNRSMPPGVIIPVLAYDDLGAAVAWLRETFGFRERLRIDDHRSQLVLNGQSIVATAGGAPPLPAGAARYAIMVRVADVDAHYDHVVQSGGRVAAPPETYPFGERQYSVDDIGGHRWTFTESVTDSDPDEWGGRLIEP